MWFQGSPGSRDSGFTSGGWRAEAVTDRRQWCLRVRFWMRPNHRHPGRLKLSSMDVQEYLQSRAVAAPEPNSTHRPLSSSFSGLPYRIPNINHKKELLRGLWVYKRSTANSMKAEREFTPERRLRQSRRPVPNTPAEMLRA